MKISELYNEIAQCNRCGFCQVACPIFRATGHEAGVARGRLALLRALIEGRLDWSANLEEPLFACLLCGACTTNCFPAVPTADLVVAAREEFLERVGRKRLHTLLFEHLLPYPGRIRLAAKAVTLGNLSGLSSVASALGLLRIFGPNLHRGQEIVGPLPRQSLRERIRPATHEGLGKDLRIGYFVGCGMDIVKPAAAEASLGLLCTLGKRVHVLPNNCCGLPAKSYGDLSAAKRLAEKNLEMLTLDEFDLLVTDCSSCAAFLKRYPALFTEGEVLHAKACAVASLVRDIVELPWSHPLPSSNEDGPVIVTYHDPCHASRSQGLVKEPRSILRSMAEIEYRELPEADWCCGGAGSYAFFHYELAMKVLQRKMDNLEKTGASVLATSCPACIIHLAYGIRLRNLPVNVCHISEVVQPRVLKTFQGE